MKIENFTQAEIRKEDLKYVKGGGYQRFCPRCGTLCNVIFMDPASGAFQFECPKCSYISEVIII